MLVRESRYWRWLFHCEPVRGPLICHGGAWAGRLRRRYPPCQATGAPPAVPVAALPAQLPAVLPAVLLAVLRVVAHESRPASIPRMSHAIPRHCVSLRNHIVGIATFADTIESSPNRIACETAASARELPAFLAARVGPLIRAWVRWYARQRRPGAYLGVGARVMGLTRIVSGSCASDTPGGAVASTTQTTLPTTPRCRRLSPRWFATWAPRCPEA